MKKIEFGPKSADNVALLVAAMGYPVDQEPIIELELAIGATKIVLSAQEVPAVVFMLFHYLVCVVASLTPDSSEVDDGYHWVLDSDDRSHAIAFAGENWPPRNGEETPHFVLAFWYFCAQHGTNLAVTVLRTRR